ncbi:hypothetical protein K438DRAFT_1587470, partial [Mycena galopus ATCC 62051]
HWILTFVRLFHGLQSTPDMASALVFFANNSQVLLVTRSTVGQIALLIGDAIIVYRLWHIWSWDLRVIILPTLSWLGNLGKSLRRLFQDKILT